jgi:hypothetical protein
MHGTPASSRLRHARDHATTPVIRRGPSRHPAHLQRHALPSENPQPVMRPRRSETEAKLRTATIIFYILAGLVVLSMVLAAILPLFQ